MFTAPSKALLPARSTNNRYRPPSFPSSCKGHSAQSGAAHLARRSEEGESIRNGLLGALGTEGREALLPFLERVPIKRRQVLQERHVPMAYAYFIERGAACVMARAGNGSATLEVGTRGGKDVVGVPIILGTMRSPHRCVVMVPGEALRIQAEDLRHAMEKIPRLERLLLSYVQAAFVQSTQLAVCNARHSLRERLTRWLLVAQDRLDADEIPITHQALGRAIGVRRAGVTTAVGCLEESGILRRGRGRIRIVDRERLEQASCECFRVIRAEHERIICETADDGRRSDNPPRRLPTPAAANGNIAHYSGTCSEVGAATGRQDLCESDHTKTSAVPSRSTADWHRVIAEKDARLHELHHRTKNSLQVISSLLAIEARDIADPAAASRLHDAQQRVRSLARIHEQLNGENAPSSERLDPGAQLKALCEHVGQSYGADERRVGVHVDAQPCLIEPGKVAPLSFIACELVTNALKHATGSGIPGRVHLRFGPAPAPGQACLSVCDDGPGLPSDFHPSNCRGLGMRLVATFARQLGGTFDFSRGTREGRQNGARFTILFPVAANGT
jgi:two-component sensor histidine kinase